MQPNFIRSRETIGWIDALRVFAILLVVLSHCCDNYTALYGIDDSGYLLGAAFGSLVRPCVPLFAMMTGVLLLPVKRDITLGAFYRKRISRLILPLIFWSLALPIANYLAFNYVWPEPANHSLVGPFNLHNLVNHLYTWVLNFNYDTTPLWYLYMLIGIYLLLPIVSRWLDSASKKDIQLLLCVWTVSLLVPYIQIFAPSIGYEGNYDNMGIWGVCSWNAFGSFYYVSGFIGYMVLAYYLTKYPVNMSRIKLGVALSVMFIIGYAVTLAGYMSMMSTSNWALIELYWSFCSINVLMMTLPVFIVAQRSDINSRQWLTKLAVMSFGVYLCHFSIVQFGYEILYVTGLPAWTRLILNFILSVTVSYLVVWAMYSSRLLKRFVA